MIQKSKLPCERLASSPREIHVNSRMPQVPLEPWTFVFVEELCVYPRATRSVVPAAWRKRSHGKTANRAKVEKTSLSRTM